jgi:TolB protein
MRVAGKLTAQILGAARWFPEYAAVVVRRSPKRTAWRFVTVAAVGLAAVWLVGAAQARSHPRNGRLITFARQTGTKTGVYVMHADGTHVKLLTPQLDFAREARFSPDGSTILFQGEPLEGGDQVLTMRTNGSHVRDLTPNEGENDGPSYSPNGRKIAYRHQDSIAVMKASGKGTHDITQGAFDASPYWSPTGKLIAFERSTASGSSRIDVVRPDGSHAHKLTSGKALDVGPAFAPNGRVIAFTRFVSDTSSKILTIHANGKHLHTLIPNADSPSYSPDGHFILFDRPVGQNFELYKAHADGSDVHRIGDKGLPGFGPSWQPKP